LVYALLDQVFRQIRSSPPKISGKQKGLSLKKEVIKLEKQNASIMFYHEVFQNATTFKLYIQKN